MDIETWLHGLGLERYEQAYRAAVRAIDASMKVPAATLGKVPFDLEKWKRVASEKFSTALPEARSTDPTQWIFD